MKTESHRNINDNKVARLSNPPLLRHTPTFMCKCGSEHIDLDQVDGRAVSTELKMINSGGSRIFPGGAPTPKSAIIFQFFAENCMKMKEFGPPGGRASLVPPLDPPMIN